MGANGEGKKIPNFLEPGTDGTRGRGGRARMEEEGTHPLPLHIWGRERGHGTLRAPSGASFHSHGVSQSAEEWLAFGVVEGKLRSWAHILAHLVSKLLNPYLINSRNRP